MKWSTSPNDDLKKRWGQMFKRLFSGEITGERPLIREWSLTRFYFKVDC